MQVTSPYRSQASARECIQPRPTSRICVPNNSGTSAIRADKPHYRKRRVFSTIRWVERLLLKRATWGRGTHST
jgi:hypothetical protein